MPVSLRSAFDATAQKEQQQQQEADKAGGNMRGAQL